MVKLIPAAEAYEQASAIQQVLYDELVTKAPFVIEQLNDRIIKAVDAGKMFIELTREEIETVPDVKPEVFVGFLQNQGYTLLSPAIDKYFLYFYNPQKD